MRRELFTWCVVTVWASPFPSRLMLHPVHSSFRLPATYVALCEFLRDNRDFHDDQVPKWSNAWSDLLLCDSGPLNPLEDPGLPVEDDPIELSYRSQPMEIVPFGWEGFDALHCGWAVLAPELALERVDAWQRFNP